MRSVRWWRVLAAVALVAALVGVPVAVVMTVGVPGPTSVRWRSLWSAERLGADAVVYVGVVLFAVLWAWFAVTAVLELAHVAKVRRTGSPLEPNHPSESPTAAVRALVRFIAIGSIAVGAAGAPWPGESTRHAAAQAPVDVRVSRAEERLRASLGQGIGEVEVGAVSAVDGIPAVGLAAAGAGSALVLATAAVAAIDRRRRAQWRGAVNGSRPAPRTIEQVRLEMQLRSLAGTRRLSQLDVGVETEVRAAAADGERPTVITVAPKGGSVTLATTTGDATRAVMTHLGCTPDGAEVFVDLEALGVLAVASPMADDVVGTLATSLHAVSPPVVSPPVDSSDADPRRRWHTVVAAGVEVNPMGGDRVERCGSMVEAIEVSSRRADSGGSAVVVGRIDEGDPMRPWLASVVGNGSGVAAVVAGDVPGAGATLRATAEGHVLEPFGVMVTPAAVSAEQRREIESLVEAAGAPPEAHGMVVPFNRSSSTASPGGPTAPRDWSFMVRVLGRVVVTTAAGDEVRFERAKSMELLVWHVHHRTRPARSAARAALWDTDVSDATFANVVSAARRSLDRAVAPGDAGHWLGKITADLMPLHGAVVSDADVVAAAVEVARSLPPREAVGVLRPAVELVEGMPFAGTAYLWPDAEGVTSWLVLLATGAAADLATHYLSLGDVEGVFWATGRGLAVLSGHEELIALRMRAHARRGDLAGVRAEWDSHVRAVAADSWSPASPSPKLAALRAELLEGAAAG